MMRATGRKGTHSLCGAFLLFTNFLLFAIMTAIAAHIIDSEVIGKTQVASNTATYTAVLLALIAGAVGLCTTLLGFMHSGFWNEAARFSALSANVVTLGLTWLAAGMSSRAIRSHAYRGAASSYRGQFLTMSAFLIILMLTTLGYVVHLGLFRHDDAVGYNNHAAVGHGHTAVGHKVMANDNTTTHAAAPGSTVNGVPQV